MSVDWRKILGFAADSTPHKQDVLVVYRALTRPAYRHGDINLAELTAARDAALTELEV